MITKSRDLNSAEGAHIHRSPPGCSPPGLGVASFVFACLLACVLVSGGAFVRAYFFSAPSSIFPFLEIIKLILVA